VAEGRLTLSMFLKPRVGADGVTRDTYDGDSDEPANNVPEFLFVQHAEAIVAGALNRVLNLPGQVFSNPARAAQYLMAFERNVDTHFALNVRGQHRAPARVRAQYI